MAPVGNFGAGDVPALLRSLGVPIEVGTATTQGLVDRVGRSVLDSEGMAGVGVTDVVVTVQTGTLPGAVVGANVSVDGEALIIAASRKIEDGELTELICVTG